MEYKIKELDRQIEPRQKEIVRLKQQIQEMDQELGTYNNYYIIVIIQIMEH